MQPDQVITSLDPIITTTPSTSAQIPLSSLNQAMVLIPVTVFLLTMVITLILAYKQNHFSAKHIFKGFQLSIILGAIPIGLLLVLGQTQFVTQAEYNPAPRNVRIYQEEETTYVSWRTATATTSGYRLSTSADMESIVAHQIINQPKRDHQFELTTITPGVDYYLEIYADTSWYNAAGDPLLIKLTLDN